MVNITCEMCMDLIPLVQDGIASNDSCQAVRQHIAHCPDCKALFEGELPPIPDSQKILGQIKRKIRLFFLMALMFGMFFGLSLTTSQGMFYNTLIMPGAGILGYCIFRWRALYVIPGFLLVLHPVSNVVAVMLEGEPLNLPSILLFTWIYSIFALAGTIIAGLIHFAFRKEREL